MISVKNLIFEYPGKRVLHDINFEIAPQTICALVGPNGAGKTTLLRCISSLNRPFAGSVHVAEMDVHEHPRECHKNIAYLTDFFGLYEKLTVRQSLEYMSQAYGIEKSKQRQAQDWVIERLDLQPHINKKASELSRGMRQRLGIAFAIIHKPQVILLDEPASGLDPEARHSLSHLLVDLKQAGMTLVVSSHILAELEEYSDEMLIIRDGKIIEQKSAHHEQSENLSIIIKAASDPEQIMGFLEQQSKCHHLSKDANQISLQLQGDDRMLAELLSQLVAENFQISEFYKSTQSMHDVYMKSVNSALLRSVECKTI